MPSVRKNVQLHKTKKYESFHAKRPCQIDICPFDKTFLRFKRFLYLITTGS